MVNKPQMELFRSAFLNYFEEDILLPEFDKRNNLVVFANPYHNFDELIVHICDNIQETIYFDMHLNVRLYPFGSNDSITIRIN